MGRLKNGVMENLFSMTPFFMKHLQFPHRRSQYQKLLLTPKFLINLLNLVFICLILRGRNFKPNAFQKLVQLSIF